MSIRAIKDMHSGGQGAIDERMMGRAIKLATKGLGLVSPNPPVGAVIAKGECIVGEGWHRALGKSHAEVEALRAAGSAGRGATLYVTLEPCNHTGRTPPCTEALIRSGVARVVYAVADPNPLARGGGELLRQAGVEVVEGVGERDARVLARAFLNHIAHRSPWVTLNIETSIDGSIATQGRGVEQILGEGARHELHRLRQSADAIVVGAGMVIRDDPILNVRLPSSELAPENVRDPRIILFDYLGHLPLGCKVLAMARNRPTSVVVGESVPPSRLIALERLGADVVVQPTSASFTKRTFLLLLKELGAEDVQSLVVEGGSSVRSAFVDAGLVDEVVSFIPPALFGGTCKIFEFSGDAVKTPKYVQQLDDVSVEAVGKDWKFRGFVHRGDKSVLNRCAKVQVAKGRTLALMTNT